MTKYLSISGVILLLIMLAMCNTLLSAEVSSLYQYPLQDSLIAIADSAQTGFMADYRKQKHDSAIVSLSLDLKSVEAGFPFFSMDYTGPGSDFIDVSRELVDEYYSRKILLYNFMDQGFLYLSLKDAQNTRGLLQVKIPLNNLRDLFRLRKHRHKRKK